jgi:CTP synthase
MAKYIFITGGVCSSLGKGLAAASIANLLEGHTLNVRLIKIDPYINLDAGTMNPYQHGEVYVTDDGAETDLDLGNYARFTNCPLSRANSITTGQIYQEIIRKEREGRFLGRTIQVIPHVTDEIKQRIRHVGQEDGVEVTIIEIGGTVGDIESVPFLEAARQFIHDVGKQDVLYIHLTLVPTVSNGELKTKPTQHSVKELLEIGIQPDILLCRAEVPLQEDLRRKISLFTNVEEDAVFSAYNVPDTIYQVPLIFAGQKIDKIIMKKLDITHAPVNKKIKQWQKLIESYIAAAKTVRIGIVGKYIELHDSYKSIFEALAHGGMSNNVKVELVKFDSEKIESIKDLDGHFKDIHGILVPGGFGQRGIEGMIRAANYARLHNIPYFGICLGMQVMVIEFARNVLGLKDANSTEFEQQTSAPVISLLEEQQDIKVLGGSMRLGKSASLLHKDSRIYKIYKKIKIHERHRHRYEVSNNYRSALENGGLKICGTTVDGELVEAVEWGNHTWGIGVQFHPEFISKPDFPHPVFADFINACMRHVRT